MTFGQNIGFPLTLKKMKKAQVAEKVAEVAKILDLTQLLDRKPAQLSGGQRQRVAMGRAIIRRPKAFLMDEPLSNLDAKLRVQMRGEIARLQRRLGTTTVYVTHDQTEAMTLGDRVVVMNGGVVQQIGTPDELYQRPANKFVAGFIGSPAMNFFAATRIGSGIRLPFGEVTLAVQGGEGGVVVGCRPEHIGDAALLDATQRAAALTFTATVDLVESVGADKFVYFSQDAHSELVARVPAESRAAKGQQLELAIDTARLALFDADTGISLTVAPG